MCHQFLSCSTAHQNEAHKRSFELLKLQMSVKRIRGTTWPMSDLCNVIIDELRDDMKFMDSLPLETLSAFESSPN